MLIYFFLYSNFLFFKIYKNLLLYLIFFVNLFIFYCFFSAFLVTMNLFEHLLGKLMDYYKYIEYHLYYKPLVKDYS
jgi:hypothetical protein